MKIALVTDSTCDLPADMVAARGITIAHMNILWGTQSFKDGIDMTNEVFYERLVQDPVLPKTSQPSPGDFADKFREARASQGADAVVCITVGSRLSGTFQSAETAVGLVDFPVRVIDSCIASMALGFIVLAAADARDRGADLDEVTQTARNAAERAQIYFTPDTLEFLHRGGRIGGARRFIGTALKIKPILQIKEGVVESVETVRTRTRAVARMVEIAVAQGRGSGKLWLGVVHTYAPEVQNVMQQLQDALKPDLLLQNMTCPTVGVHTGPAVLGIARLDFPPES